MHVCPRRCLCVNCPKSRQSDFEHGPWWFKDFQRRQSKNVNIILILAPLAPETMEIAQVWRRESKCLNIIYMRGLGQPKVPQTLRLMMFLISWWLLIDQAPHTMARTICTISPGPRPMTRTICRTMYWAGCCPFFFTIQHSNIIYEGLTHSEI